METIKALSPSDTHFFMQFDDCTLDVDAVKVILLWNEAPVEASLSEKYDCLRRALTTQYSQDFDLSNAYLILEKACAIVVSLKKTLLGSPNSNLSESGLTGVPIQN